MTEREPPLVGIAGVGLIGASIGLRAAQLGWSAVGWDRNGGHLEAGLERGALSAAAGSLREVATTADILVLAAPPDATLSHLAELGREPGRARLVIDVASVKVPVARAAAGLPNFVGTHPIAGSERSGPGAGRADLFASRVWTYDAAAPGPLARRAVAFIEAMGARAYAVANAEHDRILAATSHVPQLLSVALGVRLGALLDAPDAAALCGPGLRSMLRLGSSSWDVWQPILALNAAPVAQEVRRLVDVLTSVATELDEGRTAALGGEFAAAAAAIARLDESGRSARDAEFGKHASHER